MCCELYKGECEFEQKFTKPNQSRDYFKQKLFFLLPYSFSFFEEVNLDENLILELEPSNSSTNTKDKKIKDLIFEISTCI